MIKKSKDALEQIAEAKRQRNPELGYEPTPYDQHKWYGFETHPLKRTTHSVPIVSEENDTDQESSEQDQVEDDAVCSICHKWIFPENKLDLHSAKRNSDSMSISPKRMDFVTKDEK